jgi:hypothetical protein
VRPLALASCSLVALGVACQSSPDHPPYLPDSDGSTTPPPPTGGPDASGGDGGGDAGAVTVLGPASNPRAIVVSGKYVYFTNFGTGANQDGSIGFLTNDFSSAPGSVESPVTAPWAMTLAGQRIYYTRMPTSGTGSVEWISTTGGTAVVVQSNVTNAYGIVNDGTNVYFTHDVSGAGVAIQSVAIGTTGGTDILDLGGDLLPTALALSGASLFVATQGTQAAVLAGPTSGAGNFSELDAPSSATMGDVVATSTTVYVTIDDAAPNGAILAYPSGGGSPQTIASGLNQPQRMAIDGTHLYFTDPADGDVWVVDLGSNAIALFASGLTSPLPITVADAVYVGDADAILQIPKL